MSRRRIGRLALAALAASLALPAAADASLRAYPSAQRVKPGTFPRGGARELVLHAARDGYVAGQVAVRRRGGVVRWAPGSSLELVARATLLRVAQTRVRGRRTPDPLPRLGTRVRAPAVIFVRFSTDLAAGTYRARLAVGKRSIRVVVRVSSYTLPSRAEGFRTLFLIQPQSYFQALDGHGSLQVADAATGPLFKLLSDYRISPGDWGYGEPTERGYVGRSANVMRRVGAGDFNTFRLPLSNQRQVGRFRGGVSPLAPESWARWLTQVRDFWRTYGFAQRAVAWTWDEPGPARMQLLGRQARALHEAFPEAKLMSTVTPGAATRRLRDGGADDLDIWTVLSRRFYGTFRAPRKYVAAIGGLRRHGKEVWSYTYHGVPGSPSYDATEALTNPRLFFVWNALEGVEGTLYGDGMVRYKGRNPWRRLPNHGQSVLIYPGSVIDPQPISSLRLEAIRDGIQDANLFTAYAQRFGRRALVRLAARSGLFRARGGRLLLGCTTGCDLRSTTKFSFPVWQRDERRAARGLERARRHALIALARPAR